jgi:STE24 endopeptidase
MLDDVWRMGKSMNIFFVIMLAALILEFVLELTANLLNLKALKLESPLALKEIYEAEDYRKSQEYIRATTRLGLASSTLALFLLLAFWLSGGFNYLDQVVRAWGFIPIVNGVIYIGMLLLAYGLLTLPFSIYDTFVIEERFGFNRTTPKTFFLDHLKELTLALLLGGPLLAAILVLFQYAGTYAWLYCWAGVGAYTLFIQYAAPTWIMPLFNKFMPMEQGELKEAILVYTRSVDFAIRDVFIMDASRRSSKSNAFFTGFGRSKRIALFDTLMEKHSVPEMVAILAHEVGHYKQKHVLQGTVISILHTGLMFFLLSLFLNSPGLYQAFHMTHQSIYAGLLFFGLLYTPLELVFSIVLRMISRRNEYDADRFAAKTITDPRSLTDALKKLSAANLSNLTPHPFYVFLSYSHPPLLQRVQAIQELKHKSDAE